MLASLAITFLLFLFDFNHVYNEISEKNSALMIWPLEIFWLRSCIESVYVRSVFYNRVSGVYTTTTAGEVFDNVSLKIPPASVPLIKTFAAM